MTVSKIPVITNVSELRKLRKNAYLQGAKVGFIPTMGFLHAGHLSLISKSLQDNDITIVSIFVNPSQFSPNEDLDSYPRNLGHDLSLLSSLPNKRKVTAVFAPTVSEMYPSGIPLDFKLQKGAFVTVTGVSEQLEGASRPLFFRGVATIVTKLFNVVQPDFAYFGQKDIQQTVVIKRMVKDLLLGVQIIIGETVRADSGLALSSRNEYLSDDSKEKATTIYKSLKLIEDSYSKGGELKVKNLENLLKNNLFKVNNFFDIDYISFNDVDNLDYLTDIDPKKGCIVSLAAKVPNDVNDESKGVTRLIDNFILAPIS